MHDVNQESRDPAVLLEEIAVLRQTVERLERRVDELDHLAHLDALVPTFNRRGMLRELDMIIARHDRHGTPAAILFVDIDGLKQLNDSHGHASGDAALIHVAQHMLDGTRATDCVARVGGDEFCILLDGADEVTAMETAERLVNVVAGDELLFEGQSIPLSVAIGMTPVEQGDTAQSVLARADQAMYRVKAAAA